ncbi:MAG TPA: hypothetical protein VFK80_05315, partial [Limnochordia bacterium]|nr:hypothetical protein [Limnochordia bacterium]
IGVFEPTFFGKNRAVLPLTVVGVGTTLYTTTDGGDTWQITGRQPTWGAPQFVNADVGRLTDGMHLYVTQDGGRSWQEQAPDAALQALLADHRIETIDFVSAQRGWLLLQPRPETDAKPMLLKTTDGGASWTSL